MKYILLLLPFVYHTALAQQKESTVSISCYTNPELYIQANVIAHVSDKTGKTSCKGKYVYILNKSANTFYYKSNNKWLAVKPQGKTVVLVASAGKELDYPSILKLNVKYKPVSSRNLSAKISAISQMNAKTDQVKEAELAGIKKQLELGSNPPDNTLAKTSKPVPSETSKPAPSKPDIVQNTKEPEDKPEPKQPEPKTVPTQKRVVAKAKPRPAQQRREPEQKHPANARGLRVDFGSDGAGIGPNYKHKFNRKLALDAAIIFFENDLVGLGAQIEQHFAVKNSPGLNWYIGIGPQFLVNNENNAIALVPVTGVDYVIPNSPLNLSFDWRPNFYLSPETNVEAGRFGLSLRIVF